MSCPPGSIPYRIKAGDTLHALAQRFNTTPGAIRMNNPGLHPNQLQVNALLCIPVRRLITPCPPGSRYVIKAGDTFSKIAQRYGLSLSTLQSLNSGVEPHHLQIGQVICVPRRRRRP